MPVRLLNRCEETTYIRLRDVAAENSGLVFPKVRIADVLSLNGSGIGSELFHFGLSAHFDFVVSDSNYVPLFAVEFDGPLHTLSGNTWTRDQKKNRICEHFDFPLLRINSRYIDQTYRGMDLLTYFANCWYLAKGFFDAQENGQIPYDEPFDPCMIYHDGSREERWPYWLSIVEQVYIQKLYEAKRVVHPCVSEWIGIDDKGNYRCIAWIKVSDNRFVTTSTGMRNQQFPVDECDVLHQLAVFDIRREVDRYLSKPTNAIEGKEIDRIIGEYESMYKMMACGGCGTAM